jgi:hypothetical protein
MSIKKAIKILKLFKDIKSAAVMALQLDAILSHHELIYILPLEESP